MESELERYKMMRELINKLIDNNKNYSEETYKKIALEAKEQLGITEINLHLLSLYLARNH